MMVLTMRLTRHPTDKAIILLMPPDFGQPIDCFFEDEVLHWTNPGYRKETWGETSAPLNLNLSDSCYEHYRQLATATQTDSLKMVYYDRGKSLITNLLEHKDD